MKKTFPVALVIVVTLSIVPALGAVDTASTETSVETESLYKPKKFQFSAQIMTGDYEYKEPGLMSISGEMSGLALGTEVQLEQLSAAVPVSVVGEVDYLQGEPKYVGSYLGSGASASSDSEDYYYNVRALAKAVVNQDPVARTSFDIATGLGYRYLNDDSDGPGSYEREQTYLYVPIVLGLNVYTVSNKWQYRMSFELDSLVKGKNKSHFSDVDPNSRDLEFEQDEGSGTKISLIAIRNFEKYSMFLELYQRSWSIEDSTSDGPINTNKGPTMMMEPANSTKFTALSIGAMF